MKRFMNFWGKMGISVAAVFLCSMIMFAFPSKAASLHGANNEEKIYYYLIENMDMNTAGAAGVLANMYYESTFNPRAGGDDGTSYGICQWHDGRYEDLKRYCKREGYDYKSLEGQLEFLNDELNGDYYYRTRVLAPILEVSNNKKGAYAAGYTWCYYFEIPADKETKADARGNLAKAVYFPKYKKKMTTLTVGETYETDEGSYIALSKDTVRFVEMDDPDEVDLDIPDTVTIGDVTAKVTEIGNGVCKNTKLESLYIGKYVKKIGKNAFYKCKYLNDITIESKKIKSIGKKAFLKIDPDAVFYVDQSVSKKYKKLLKKTAPKTIKIEKED